MTWRFIGVSPPRIYNPAAQTRTIPQNVNRQDISSHFIDDTDHLRDSSNWHHLKVTVDPHISLNFLKQIQNDNG